MGRNAQRRRVEKQAARAERPATVRRTRLTHTQQRLRRQMRQVATLAQFEQILADAHADSRGAMRRILTPMLAPGLPCCGQAALAARTGQTLTAGQHALYCPTRNTPTIVPQTFDGGRRGGKDLIITRVPDGD
jgi:hypothetical protein